MGVRSDREFDGIRLTTAHWPIIVNEYPEKAVSDEGLSASLTHLESLMVEATRTKERVFVITDISRMHHLPQAGQRQIVAKWLKRVSPLARVASNGGATVTPSPILRGLVTAIFWLQPSPNPFFCVSNRHEAMLKGIELFRAASVPLSPALAQIRARP